MGPPVAMCACGAGPGAAGGAPAYRTLLAGGGLARRARDAGDLLQDCVLCARHCHADRTESARGAACRTGNRARVSSFGPHHGEEEVLRGHRGSGTIFFAWCNLRCDFCQNWEISQRGEGREVEPREIAAMMLALERAGCHNINLVSPSHVVAPVLEAVLLAAEAGLRLPLVYNTGGYDSPEALRLLDGVVDIYMPDMKFADEATARRHSHAPDYPAVNRAAVREMHRQVGDLQLGPDGIARRGLLVRHLVLPGGLAGTERIVAFLAQQISRDTWLNLMDQYRPAWRAGGHPPLDRRPTSSELREARALAHRHGLRRLDPRT